MAMTDQDKEELQGWFDAGLSRIERKFEATSQRNAPVKKSWKDYWPVVAGVLAVLGTVWAIGSYLFVTQNAAASQHKEIEKTHNADMQQATDAIKENATVNRVQQVQLDDLIKRMERFGGQIRNRHREDRRDD